MADPRPHLHPLFAGILADWRTAVTPNPRSPKPQASRAMRKLSLSLLALAACTGPGPAPDRSGDARWTLTHYLAAVSRPPEDHVSHSINDVIDAAREGLPRDVSLEYDFALDAVVIRLYHEEIEVAVGQCEATPRAVQKELNRLAARIGLHLEWPEDEAAYRRNAGLNHRGQP